MAFAITKEGPTLRSSSQQEIATPTNSALSNSKKYFTTKKITYLATMTAITLFLKLSGGAFSLAFSESLRISFVYLAWLIAGLTLGAIGGGIVGGASDILSSLLLGWAFNPLLTVSNIVFPMIIGAGVRYLPTKNVIVKLIISTFVACIISTLTISTVALYIMYDIQISFFTYLLTTRTIQIAVVAVNLFICIMLLPALQQLKLFNE